MGRGISKDSCARLPEPESPGEFDLTGRVAVVTGAARGLGQAAAVGLARFGADVAAIDLSAAACRATCDTIGGLGRRCRAYACDVSDRRAVARVVGRIQTAFGRIDIVA